MLRIPALIVGLLPLGLLTIGSFLPAWSADPTLTQPENLSQLDLSKVQSAADEADKQTDAEVPLVADLVGIDVFGAGALPKGTPSDPADRFAAVAIRLQRLADARDALRAYAEVYASQPKPSESEERKKLEAFRTKTPLDKIGGARNLQDVIQARIERLDLAITSRNALEKAKQSFGMQQYDDCKKALQTLNTDGLSEQDQRLAKVLKARAEFFWHWRPVPEADQPIKLRWKQLDNLLRSSPLPADDDQIDYLAKRRAEVTALGRRIRVDGLFDDPPGRVRDLAEDCQRILIDDPQSKDRIRAGVERWITSRLLKKPIFSTPEIVEEAWMKDGRYLQGVFEKVPGDDPDKSWYKFWGSVARYQAAQAFENQIYRSELRVEPARPLDVRLTNEFNAQRRELLRDIGSKGRWESFALQCESWQKQIEEYYLARQPPAGRLSFQSARDLTREVLAQWKLVGIILAN
jgi:hypothetical protein